jgi:hypothetical protein
MAKKRPATAATYRVFVSHATADKWIAKTICEKIDAVPGCSTFRDDRDIGGGERIATALQAELVRSDELLLLLTPASLASRWVTLEVGAAWGLGMRIVPVCYNTSIDQVALVSDYRGYALDDLERYLEGLRERSGGGRT